MKSLLQYKKIDEEISKVASEKLANHLWYLSEDLVALALFDNQVPHCIKRQMIKAMKEVNGKNNLAKRPDIKLKNFMDMKFEDFATKRSALLFKRMSTRYFPSRRSTNLGASGGLLQSTKNCRRNSSC
ncbi:hypothetical protein AVEN_269435-1 [Araneus ventricosus]|uniref:Uncharacterized protein n=1 Tax=Araneus ventricosus TaxID=182803 RepID=A0A4Y2JI56_ARAVE|nr:hypothetical protein AVEN_269435-1 [Araneus ventricosus]